MTPFVLIFLLGGVLSFAGDAAVERYCGSFVTASIGLALLGLAVIVVCGQTSLRRYGVVCEECGKQLLWGPTVEIVIASRNCPGCGVRVLSDDKTESDSPTPAAGESHDVGP